MAACAAIADENSGWPAAAIYAFITATIPNPMPRVNPHWIRAI